jgi:hypothetical protein
MATKKQPKKTAAPLLFGRPMALSGDKYRFYGDSDGHHIEVLCEGPGTDWSGLAEMNLLGGCVEVATDFYETAQEAASALEDMLRELRGEIAKLAEGA